MLYGSALDDEPSSSACPPAAEQQHSSPAPFSHWDRFPDSSGFTGLGQPQVYQVPRRRVWERDIPPRWRRLTIKTPRGYPGLGPSEAAAIVKGGFWQPSVSPVHPTARPGSTLSSFMQAQMRVLQHEAEEVVQMLRHGKQRFTASITSSTSRLGRGTGAVLKHSWRWMRALCCCGADAAEQAHEDDCYSSLQGTVEYTGDDDSHMECDATSDVAMHEAAEQELQRRMAARLAAAVAAQGRLRVARRGAPGGGGGDSLRSPLLAAVDSAADLGGPPS